MTSETSQWTEYLSCPLCSKIFNEADQKPISLACGHTVCWACLSNLPDKKCPYDPDLIIKSIDDLPVNYTLLKLVGAAVPREDRKEAVVVSDTDHASLYESCRKHIEELAIHIKSDDESDDDDESTKSSSGSNQTATNSVLSRPMQRKLLALKKTQSEIIEDEGRARALRAARSLGERTVAELILQHQNPQQLSANLWAGVRARGCQFLGPAMQEEVLKLILFMLDDGSSFSRKDLVLFVVQKLEPMFPQASKTAIGHVVQLLYRASCFKVTKQDEKSSLMQLKEEFKGYEALRREHDSQIVQIAMEAGLRISPEQWASLLYADSKYKSHMQSIIDKLQTPQSFSQSVNELMIALQRTGDPGKLQLLKPHLETLAMIDPSQDKQVPSWENLEFILKALKTVVQGLVNFLNQHSFRRSESIPAQTARYKTSMCRDYTTCKSCPRGANCTFAHSEEELDRFRAKKKFGASKSFTSFTALTPKDKDLALVNMKSSSLDYGIKHTSVVNPLVVDNKLKTDTTLLKSVPMTNIVKPMVALSVTTTIISLTTDTSTSLSTSSSIPSVSTTCSSTLVPATTTNSANLSSNMPPSPRVPPFALQPEAVYYPPQTDPQLHRPPPPPLPVHRYPATNLRQPLTGAAARYPPLPLPPALRYPLNQPHPPPHPPCVPGYGYGYDGMTAPPPVNYPESWLHQQAHTAPTYFPYVDQNRFIAPGQNPPVTPVYAEQLRWDETRFQPRPAANPPIHVPVGPVATANTPLVLPIQPSQIPNQVNSLQDLQNRRQEILSQIHENIQLTPVNVQQFNSRGHISNQEQEKSTGSNFCNFGNDQCQFTTSGLSQTEKAYTILKKELYTNPKEAADPKELSLPTLPISINALKEFQSKINQFSTTSEGASTTPQSLGACSLDDVDDTDTDWLPKDFNLGICLDDDVEADGDDDKETFSSVTWSSTDDSTTNIGPNNTGNLAVDLFDWFQKSQSSYVEENMRFSVGEGDDFIPFYPPIVSRFGPISRTAKLKMRNCDPVIVTADEAITRMTPVTAITPTQRPYPVTSPAPSRYKIPGQKTLSHSSASAQPVRGEPHTLWHQYGNVPSGTYGHLSRGHHLHQELNRLEYNATEARTEDERLAYELNAIELKISMHTGKRPEPVEQPNLEDLEPPASLSLSNLPSQVSSYPMTVQSQNDRNMELNLSRQKQETERYLTQRYHLEELRKKRESKK